MLLYFLLVKISQNIQISFIYVYARLLIKLYKYIGAGYIGGGGGSLVAFVHALTIIEHLRISGDKKTIIFQILKGEQIFNVLKYFPISRVLFGSPKLHHTSLFYAS